jgi:Flp pilus assembly protein TadB
MTRQRKSNKQRQPSKPPKSSKQAARQSSRSDSQQTLSRGATRNEQQKASQITPRKVFTIAICVLVALGLMLPVTGIGIASCSTTLQDQQSPQDDQSPQP